MNTLSRIKKEASQSPLVQSSKSALKKASTIWKRQEKLDQESVPGSSVKEISTTYLPSSPPLKMTCLQDIRKDLLNCLIAIPNLVYIEQPGGFYVKVYSHEKLQEEDSIVEKMSTLLRFTPPSTPRSQSSDQVSKEKQLPILIHNNVAPYDMVPILQFEIFIRQFAFTKQFGLQFYRVSGNQKKYHSIVSCIRSKLF